MNELTINIFQCKPKIKCLKTLNDSYTNRCVQDKRMKSKMTKEIKEYLNHIKFICPEITEIELEKFSNGLTVSKIKKNNFYITKGDIQNQGGFLIKGLIRVSLKSINIL